MGKQTNYDFTREQEMAIGQLVADRWGHHFRTGFDEAGRPLIYSQRGPKDPIRSATFNPDGTVTFNA